MRRVLLSIAILGVWVACHNTTPVTAPSLSTGPPPMAVPMRATSSLRVMSYNLNFGVAGDPAAADAIASTKPQIVLLQESNDVWEASLVGTLAYPHHQFAPPKDLPAGGMGILSRYPIETVEELPSDGGPFFAWRIVVATPAGRVQILNVHLRPPMSDDGSWVKGYWTTRETRLREIAWHLQRLDQELPTILAGDWNEEGDGQAMQYAADRGFVDGIEQFAGKRRTWQWPVGSLTLRFQLDHVLYQPKRFIAVAGGIVEQGNSDHFPVWVDLELVEAT